MKYWRLYSSADVGAGFVPQIIEPIFQGQYTDENQLWNRSAKQIKSDTIIPGGHLHRRAKLTDLMSVGFAAGNMFVSEKLKNVIFQYPAVGVEFASTEVISKKDPAIPVYLMHPFITDYSFIDMNETIFQITNIMGDMIFETIQFNSINEYIKKKDELIMQSKQFEDISLHKWISFSSLAIKTESDFGICSVFDVEYGGIGFYVSETLKDEILRSNCIGVVFREINARYP